MDVRAEADLARLRPVDGALLVVSPHLDDGVLSCGRALVAHPGSAVLTVFAGSDADRTVLTDWDRLCGFRAGTDIVGSRRAEDQAALVRVGARPVWLSQAEPIRRSGPVDASAIIALIAGAIAALAPSRLLLPLGIRHPDHLLVHDLAVAAARRRPEVAVVVFQEMPYDSLYPADAQTRLAELPDRGVVLTASALPLGSRLRKFRSVGCYRTQLRGLEGRTQWGVTRRSERYWTASLG